MTARWAGRASGRDAAMRKPLAATAVILALFLALPWYALAEDEVEISVATVNAPAGGQATVDVAFEACDHVDSLQFNLNYDPSALSVSAVVPGTVFPAEYCVTNANESGRIRVACASALGLSAEDGGVLLSVTFNVLGSAGSAVTLSDVAVTVVDAEYVQSAAYLLSSDGGVTVDGGPLPAPVVTPWVAPTPIPTPSPTPEPTAVPTIAAFADSVAEPTPAPTPEPASASGPMLPYLIVGIFAVLAIAAIVIILISASASKKRRKKKKKTAGMAGSQKGSGAKKASVAASADDAPQRAKRSSAAQAPGNGEKPTTGQSGVHTKSKRAKSGQRGSHAKDAGPAQRRKKP